MSFFLIINLPFLLYLHWLNIFIYKNSLLFNTFLLILCEFRTIHLYPIQYLLHIYPVLLQSPPSNKITFKSKTKNMTKKKEKKCQCWSCSATQWTTQYTLQPLLLGPHWDSSGISWCPVSWRSCSSGCADPAPPHAPAVHIWGECWGDQLVAHMYACGWSPWQLSLIYTTRAGSPALSWLAHPLQ